MWGEVVDKWKKVGDKMLAGSFEHKLDNKGRVVLPARFRGELGNVVVATIGFEHCIILYTQQRWQDFEGKLNTLPSFKKSTRDLRRALFSNAMEQEIDAAGRIILPLQLRSYGGISQEITIVGVDDHIEIWDTERWKEYNSTLPDLAALSEELEGI